VEEGVRLRVAGQGDAGDPNAPRGDLYCVIQEIEHAFFKRNGADLVCEVPVTYAQLALGQKKLEIPTLRGRATLEIPAGTQNGKLFRLRGQGLPQLDARGRGDLLVRVFIEVPSSLTARQKELLDEFGRSRTRRRGRSPSSTGSRARSSTDEAQEARSASAGGGPVEGSETGGTPSGQNDVDALVRERDEYLASWKRAAADYQNLRRRLQSDVDAAVASRKAALLGDLLLVLDYLDMALATPVQSPEGRTSTPASRRRAGRCSARWSARA
jgi:hypothetical protein